MENVIEKKADVKKFELVNVKVSKVADKATKVSKVADKATKVADKATKVASKGADKVAKPYTSHTGHKVQHDYHERFSNFLNRNENSAYGQILKLAKEGKFTVKQIAVKSESKFPIQEGKKETGTNRISKVRWYLKLFGKTLSENKEGKLVITKI